MGAVNINAPELVLKANTEANTNKLTESLLMLSPSYNAVRQFKSQILKVSNIEELKALLKPNLTLSIRLESSMPWSVTWDVLDNSVVGNCPLSLSSKIYAGGELYEAPHSEKLSVFSNHSGFSYIETQLLNAIKHSVQTAQRKWA